MSDLYHYYHAAIFRQPTDEEVDNISDDIKESYPKDMLIVKGGELIVYLYHAVQNDGDSVWPREPGGSAPQHEYRETE